MLDCILVDDEYLIREGLKVLLDWESFDINIKADAEDGIYALKIFEEQSFDIAVIDINMPFCNGIELVRRLKKNGVDTIFIILSGYDDFKYAQQALKEGVFRYLLKPVDKFDLEEAIKDAVYEINKEKFNNKCINNYKDIIGDRAFKSIQGKEVLIDDKVIRNETIIDVVKYIQENIGDNLNLEHLSNIVHIHPNYLCSMFKNETGRKLLEYIIHLRIEKAKILLKNTDYKIYNIAQKVGYKDERYFASIFKKYVGCTPNQYKKIE
ncbi:MAG: response regulator [Clostridium sp.]|uniref:response regulator transcription factor n=1 Tax=Clostridium sp. TaxID=1506 RepID=UPI00290B87E9|nr:response regulator [Clostridium sp.]MDU5109942.1 response regulator [Clostridium sp.]